MTDYHCDISADAYADNAGTATGTAYTGPAGMQAAIRGSGAATALVAGDTLYVKAGTGSLSRLVLIDCNGHDVSAWEVGQTVRDNGGGAVLWRGTVVQERDEIATGLAADDMLLVWLDSGYTETEVDAAVASGILNTSIPDNSPGAITGSSTPGILIDTNAGTDTSPIRIVGVNSSWVEDGTTPVFDGGDKATNCFLGSKNYSYWRNVHGKDSTASVWKSVNLSRFLNCVAEGAGAHGWDTLYGEFHLCKAFDCSSYGFYGNYQSYANCVAYNCGTYGFYVYQGSAMGCVAFECSGSGGFYVSNAALFNCVSDSNSSGVVLGSGTTQIVACRITNNTSYGINSSRPTHDPYCFYSGNGANFSSDVHSDTVHGASTRITTGTVGYIDGDNATLSDRNYGLTNAATARRQEVVL